MTKNEIIRELIKCNPDDIKSLSIIYHDSGSLVEYFYDYEITPHLSLDSRRELAKVLLSLYKLLNLASGAANQVRFSIRNFSCSD